MDYTMKKTMSLLVLSVGEFHLAIYHPILQFSRVSGIRCVVKLYLFKYVRKTQYFFFIEMIIPNSHEIIYYLLSESWNLGSNLQSVPTQTMGLHHGVMVSHRPPLSTMVLSCLEYGGKVT